MNEMTRTQSVQDFLTTQNVQVSLPDFLVNLGLAALLSGILGLVYVRFGTALSNRRRFAHNFPLLAMITTLVITVVKSSLALSLGLVGALSIVRFRAPIKEPEELTYLFLAIGIGLGLGANQRVITLAAVVVFGIIVLIRGWATRRAAHQNLFLTVSSHNPGKIELPQVVRVLSEHCVKVDLRRYDEDENSLEASFLVELDDFRQLDESRQALRRLGDSVSLTFVDDKGIP